MRVLGAAMQEFLQSTWGKYLVALAAVVAAMLFRALLDPWIGDDAATVTLYGAIAVAVWHGGYKPGLFATIVGYLAANYFFIEPRGSISLETLADLGRFLGFMLSALLIIALGGAMHSARQRAEQQARPPTRHAPALKREVEDHRQTRASLEAKEGDLQIVTDTISAAVARCSP